MQDVCRSVSGEQKGKYSLSTCTELYQSLEKNATPTRPLKGNHSLTDVRCSWGGVSDKLSKHSNDSSPF